MPVKDLNSRVVMALREPVIRLMQTAPEPGDLAGNLLRTQKQLRALRDNELAVLPELALTGYQLRSGRRLVALAADDPALIKLAPPRGAALAGFVELGEDRQLYNASAWLERNRPVATHRKCFLPTYSMFEEGRFFARGERLSLWQWHGLQLGVMICEEGWHLPVPHALARAGADVLIWQAAGPEKGNRSVESWTRLATAYAELLNVYVELVNRVGVERGVSFCGGSCVIAPGGRSLLQLPAWETAEGAVALPASRLTRARRRAPMIADERKLLDEIVLHRGDAA